MLSRDVGRWDRGGWVPDTWHPDEAELARRRHRERRRPTEGPGRHRDGRRPAVLSLPSSLRGARSRPRAAAVLGVVMVVVVVLGVVGVRVVWANAAGRPQTMTPAGSTTPSGLTGRTVPVAFATATSGAPAGQGGRAGIGRAPGSATVDGGLVVHVVGQVRRPGVVRLPPGARVQDAVTAVGGPTAAADLSALNLARLVVDGEQVFVPKPGQSPVIGPAGAAGGPGSGPGAARTQVNINSADLAALDSLPGVGPVLAQRILDWRAAHGRFTSLDELGEVNGIGEKMLAQLTPKVTL